jgi:hypothetical protein
MALANFQEAVVRNFVNAGEIGGLVGRMLLSFVSAKIHIDLANKANKLTRSSCPYF